MTKEMKMRNYSIKPTTRKITIHTLELVDRGKWINPGKTCKYITLNFTFPESHNYTPKFTSMGWNGISSVTIDLQGLRDAGEKVDNEHNTEAYINNLEKFYNKYAKDKP